jgi:hypothetical protein
MTRRIISEHLQARVADEGDVRAIAVYAKPDRFDRDWKLMRTMPFVKKETRMQPGVRREAGGAARYRKPAAGKARRHSTRSA